MLSKWLKALVSLSVFVALFVIPVAVRAEIVLVEFTAADGSSLVPAGDRLTDTMYLAEEETRKRVQTRALAIEQARTALVASLPAALAATIVDDFHNFPLVVADVDPTQRLALELHPQVTAAHDNQERYAQTVSALSFVGAAAWHGEGSVGDGTAVAVLDTGIRYWNGYFGDCPEPGAEGCRVLAFEGFASTGFMTDPAEVAGRSGHGTNVGGIVGDVAPGTGLLSLGVFHCPEDEREQCTASDWDISSALDWVIEHRDEYNIVAANMSLGGGVDPGMTEYCTGRDAGAYAPTIRLVRDAGVVPVVASGNDNVKSSMTSPACIAASFAVGAGYDDPAVYPWCAPDNQVPGGVVCFSNSSALTDVIAPGVNLTAGGLENYSGTSMAAPFAAGLVAVYQARYGTAPLWTIQRIRADAVTILEDGPEQIYTHRFVRLGDHEAELVFDTGAVLASDDTGIQIYDGSDVPQEVTVDVVCESELCGSDQVGNVYVDLTIVHERTGDLVIELEAPDGALVRHAVEDDDVFGRYNVNSIVGSQHLPGVFDELRGSPVEGTWTLRLYDDEPGVDGDVHRAVLLIDSARVELHGTLDAPEIARPDEPFDVTVTLENRGNAVIEAAPLVVELVDRSTGAVVDSAELDVAVPSMPGDDSSVHDVVLQGPQGAYEVRLAGELTPDLPPGLDCEPQELDISYRTFASFNVAPDVPVPGEPAQLSIISRGVVMSHEWDFGDGATASVMAPSHSWAEAGEYEVRLTVTGPDGVSTTARTVVVQDSTGSYLDVQGGGCSCGATGAAGAPGGAAFGLFALLGLLALRRRRRSRRTRRLLVGLGLLSALVLSGCWDDDTPDQPDAGELEPEPWISLLDPAEPVMGDTLLYLMLSSSEVTACDVTLEYRIGGGDYGPATIEGAAAALTGLDAAPEGVEHELHWLATEDVPGDAEDVQLRASVSCDDFTSLVVESSPLLVLNFFVNNPHAVLVTEVSVADPNVPADYTTDYIELTNTTDETIPLDGWVLIVTSFDANGVEHALDGVTLEPAERLVITGADRGFDDAFELEGELPWTVATNGSVAVVATYDRGVDFVRWGGSPAAPAAGLQWSGDRESPLPIPQTLTVLARVDESSDTDRSDDFCVAVPTPGAAAEECYPEFAPSELLVTELDSQGTDDQVEILNNTTQDVDIGGWKILWNCDALGEGNVALGSAVIAPGQRVVLRDNGTAGRLHLGVLELGENLNIDGLIPTAVALQDPNGNVIDVLAGGGSRITWEQWTVGDATPMPGPLTTISRRPGDPDTDSPDDWCMTEVNLLEEAPECLEPLGLNLVISEVMTGRPDWVEIYNKGSSAVDLRDVYVSYTSVHMGGYNSPVGDFRLYGTLEPDSFALLTEQELSGFPDAILTGTGPGSNIALSSDGGGSLIIRDVHGFGIDIVMWGEPPGLPLYPTQWHGLSHELYPEDHDTRSIQRHPHDAEDTDTRDDWCWAYPSPMGPNVPCE